ncbi:MAG: nucleotidyltransferase [Chloroflexi bacterium]|nr:nucleotidyltransferase [Chloroflexota bacterium]
MKSTTQRFSQFQKNIQLTKDQLEDAITKHHGIRKTLHENYYSSSYSQKTRDSVLEANIAEDLKFVLYKMRSVKSYEADDIDLDNDYVYRSSLLVGSYGKGTAIAPPSDIDILFQLPRAEFTRYDSYSSNGQSKLLQDVKAVLQKRYPRTNIRADGQIISVPFTSYKIEVLPVFKLTNGKYYYPDTHNGGSWKKTDPKSEMQFLSDSNQRSNGNTVKLIKMLKAWKNYCSVPISSLVLELRAVHFLNKWIHYDKTATYHDWMIRDFMKELLAFVNGNCQIPGIEEIKYYGDKWETKAKSALAISENACEYELNSSFNLASLEWQKLFGARFPMPTE